MDTNREDDEANQLTAAAATQLASNRGSRWQGYGGGRGDKVRINKGHCGTADRFQRLW